MVYPAVLLIGLRLPALLTVPNWLQQLKTAQYLLPVTQAQRGHRRPVLATVLGPQSPALQTVPNWLQPLLVVQYLLQMIQAQRGQNKSVLATVPGLPSLDQAMALSSPRLSMAAQYTPQATQV